MSLISNIFKTSKTPSYGGIQPYGSLMDAAGGQDYYNTILARSKGNSKGYGEDYVSNANPQIAQLHNEYTGYELPELKSELTATGRREGSGGFQQIARSMADQSDKENAIKARLAQNQSEAIYNDTNNGINDLGAFNTGDFNARNTLAGFQQRQYGQDVANIQNDNSANTQKGQMIGNALVTAAGIPFTGGASYSGLGSSPINYGGQSYSTSQPPINQQNYYQQMLARGVASSGQKGRV